jgi:hypothetical protein
MVVSASSRRTLASAAKGRGARTGEEYQAASSHQARPKARRRDHGPIAPSPLRRRRRCGRGWQQLQQRAPQLRAHAVLHLPNGCLIEAPWLVHGGHGGSITSRFDPLHVVGVAASRLVRRRRPREREPLLVWRPRKRAGVMTHDHPTADTTARKATAVGHSPPPRTPPRTSAALATHDIS